MCVSFFFVCFSQCNHILQFYCFSLISITLWILLAFTKACFIVVLSSFVWYFHETDAHKTMFTCFKQQIIILIMLKRFTMEICIILHLHKHMSVLCCVRVIVCNQAHPFKQLYKVVVIREHLFPWWLTTCLFWMHKCVCAYLFCNAQSFDHVTLNCLNLKVRIVECCSLLQ